MLKFNMDIKLRCIPTDLNAKRWHQFCLVPRTGNLISLMKENTREILAYARKVSLTNNFLILSSGIMITVMIYTGMGIECIASHISESLYTSAAEIDGDLMIEIRNEKTIDFLKITKAGSKIISTIALNGYRGMTCRGYIIEKMIYSFLGEGSSKLEFLYNNKTKSFVDEIENSQSFICKPIFYDILWFSSGKTSKDINIFCRETSQGMKIICCIRGYLIDSLDYLIAFDHLVINLRTKKVLLDTNKRIYSLSKGNKKGEYKIWTESS